MDPPQTTTNVVGFKRLRKLVPVAFSPHVPGQLTIGDLRACLPISNPELRILKLSVWGEDTRTLSCVFPVGSNVGLHPGDDAAWSDIGVPGNSRAQIHVTPAFDYRNFWWDNNTVAATILATFDVSPLGTVGAQQLIVDVTVQYRTSIQSCPALVYLQQLRQEAE
jgi:hypothetical protein